MRRLVLQQHALWEPRVSCIPPSVDPPLMTRPELFPPKQAAAASEVSTSGGIGTGILQVWRKPKCCHCFWIKPIQGQSKTSPHRHTHTHMPRMVNVYLKLYLYIVWFVCVCAIVVRTPVCQTVSSYVQVTLPERLAQLPQPALLQPVLITSLSDAKWQHCSDTTWKWRVG